MYRTTTRKLNTHYPESSPSFYRRDFQGGLQRAPVSAHSMEFLRGIYAFMQVSRSSVSVTSFLSLIPLLSSKAVEVLFENSFDLVCVSFGKPQIPSNFQKKASTAKTIQNHLYFRFFVSNLFCVIVLFIRCFENFKLKFLFIFILSRICVCSLFPHVRSLSIHALFLFGCLVKRKIKTAMPIKAAHTKKLLFKQTYQINNSV